MALQRPWDHCPQQGGPFGVQLGGTSPTLGFHRRAGQGQQNPIWTLCTHPETLSANPARGGSFQPSLPEIPGGNRTDAVRRGAARISPGLSTAIHDRVMPSPGSRRARKGGSQGQAVRNGALQGRVLPLLRGGGIPHRKPSPALHQAGSESLLWFQQDGEMPEEATWCPRSGWRWGKLTPSSWFRLSAEG